MDISPLADKRQRNNNQKRRSHSDEYSRLDEYTPPQTASARTGKVLTSQRIQNLIDELNHMTGSLDITFELKQADARPTQNTTVEVVDSKRNELLLELKMQDLVDIEKQINEDSVEDLSEFMCGSFFSLTA